MGQTLEQKKEMNRRIIFCKRYFSDKEFTTVDVANALNITKAAARCMLTGWRFTLKNINANKVYNKKRWHWVYSFVMNDEEKEFASSMFGTCIKRGEDKKEDKKQNRKHDKRLLAMSKFKMLRRVVKALVEKDLAFSKAFVEGANAIISPMVKTWLEEYLNILKGDPNKVSAMKELKIFLQAEKGEFPDEWLKSFNNII